MIEKSDYENTIAEKETGIKFSSFTRFKLSGEFLKRYNLWREVFTSPSEFAILKNCRVADEIGLDLSNFMGFMKQYLTNYFQL